MGKIHVDHRVVIRDESDRIVSDDKYQSFAMAAPEYEKAIASLPSGSTVSLQHGIRISKSHTAKADDLLQSLIGKPA